MAFGRPFCKPKVHESSKPFRPGQVMDSDSPVMLWNPADFRKGLLRMRMMADAHAKSRLHQTSISQRASAPYPLWCLLFEASCIFAEPSHGTDPAQQALYPETGNETAQEMLIFRILCQSVSLDASFSGSEKSAGSRHSSSPSASQR